jgi:hypothetical protein
MSGRSDTTSTSDISCCCSYVVKGKVVPLRAIEALWVRGGIAPTLS